ncbi:caspase family protein [Variovorax sp. JS1663]|uniref:caspase family protein n=1 Tax=Variovorax sp. JS1663 TaxID=1851577 RepID=UPI000B34187E|nr:caspase family protein [Variovorax sp. JS1663]OUL99137.1 peptidase C14 [Variovorax sp. JS1663]
MIRLRRLLRAALLLALAAGAGGAGAAQRALLVGVSELVNQPASLWLQAPRNDVLLMRQALLKQGFAAPDVTVVADGVDGAALPDARRIQEALARLLEQSQGGDFVLLYFSGHGTRWRDGAKRYQEPDGLAENFLARDVAGAMGSGAPLPGGLRDVDIDGWVQAFLARGVFVGSVFDTCAAASMTRGQSVAAAVAEPADDEVRFRGIRADMLARGTAAAPAAAPAAPAAPAVPRARYVAFFASESHQVTPELRLPRKSREAQPQGLLTWAVVEALQRRPATWRELFDGVLALYPPVIAELETRFPDRELPSPVAEGNLDAPLFANIAAPVSTRPVWRAERAGASLRVQAGELDGLLPQQAVRVQATLEDGTVRSAPASLAQVGADSASAPVPASLQGLSGAALWSVVPAGEPAALALRVRGSGPLPPGIAMDYPASILLVDGGEADLRWTPMGAAGHRLDIESPALGTAGARVTVPDAKDLRQRLQALAQLKWLNRLQALGQDGRLPGFDAALEVWDGTRLLRSEAVQQAAARLPPPRAGERAVLHVRNASGQSLDMVVVGVDAQGAIRPVYPGDTGETNRFERGTQEAPATQRFDVPWLGAEGSRLLVLAVPAAPHSAPRLFGARPAEALADLRVRGAAPPERRRAIFTAMVRWTSVN